MALTRIVISGTHQAIPCSVTFCKQPDHHWIVSMSGGKRFTTFSLDKGVRPCPTVARFLLDDWLETDQRGDAKYGESKELKQQFAAEPKGGVRIHKG